MNTDSNQSRVESDSVLLAQDVLRGTKLQLVEMLDLARRLKAEKNFGYARRVLARARSSAEIRYDQRLQLRIHQESALCTYQDQDLPADERLDLALGILRQVEDLETTTDQETLGLVGSIYKRKWQLDNQKQQLERSLSFYRRGYQQGPVTDQGYTGINTAFVLDLLAHQDAEEAKPTRSPAELAEQRRTEACDIRKDILHKIVPLIRHKEHDWLAGAWWFYSTVAEAYFGLRQYERAVRWLERGQKAVGKIPEWEYEATVRQLARLTMLQSDGSPSGDDFESSPAWQALKRFFGNAAGPVRSAFTGKIGLALSGGGFRASLFHIGMLAKLAELDLLRRVEVLSCVSGGSIIGAHYYLEVRHLLQTKPDEQITRQDYVEIVSRLEKDFLAGVKRNIRVRVGAELRTNLAMIFRRNYSLTKRAGELYEREIFSLVGDGNQAAPRWLNQLFTAPMGEPAGFNPKYNNWRRESKVPILIINATTLNTGHNWQFTASWMGEPPAGISSDIDGNDYLRRMYYREAPDQHKQVRLGHAVAASASVPGVFDPLVLDRLYPERVVRLVDGGVCDNQGVAGLLEQDCSVILVSDGSGQMESQKDPSSSLLGVPLRSNTILQARVRDAQYRELRARRRSQLLRGFMFVHLKEDLSVDPVDWVDCPDPFNASDDEQTATRKDILTRYGIAKEIQRALAAVRTDLDSFSDVEAYSLMASGYRMTGHEFEKPKCIDGFSPSAIPHPWNFLSVEQGLKGTGKKYKHVKELLGVSHKRFFKIRWLSILLIVLWLIGYILPVAVLLLYVFTAVAIGLLIAFITIFAVIYVWGKIVGRSYLQKIVYGTVMTCGLIWLFLRIHLWLDKHFLQCGSIEKFQRVGD